MRKTARNARKCDIFGFYIGADAQNAEGNKTKYFTNFKKRTMPIFIILAPLSSAFGISQVRTKKKRLSDCVINNFNVKLNNIMGNE